jgi:hypothetical protein
LADGESGVLARRERIDGFIDVHPSSIPTPSDNPILRADLAL